MDHSISIAFCKSESGKKPIVNIYYKYEKNILKDVKMSKTFRPIKERSHGGGRLWRSKNQGDNKKSPTNAYHTIGFR